MVKTPTVEIMERKLIEIGISLFAALSAFAGSGTSWEDPIIVGPVAQDAFSWRATIQLHSVGLNEAGDYLDFPYSKEGGFQAANIASAGSNMSIGNVWLIQSINGTYYATVFDYLRPPAQYSKKFPESLVGHGHLVEPMTYKPNETYGLMVTTLARRDFRTTNERSNILLFEMPYSEVDMNAYMQKQIDAIAGSIADSIASMDSWEIPMPIWDAATQTWTWPDGQPAPDTEAYLAGARQAASVLRQIAGVIQGTSIDTANVLVAQADKAYMQFTYFITLISETEKYTIPEYTGDDSVMVNYSFTWSPELAAIQADVQESYEKIQQAWTSAYVAGVISGTPMTSIAGIDTPTTLVMPDGSKPFSTLENNAMMPDAWIKEKRVAQQVAPKNAKNVPEDAISWDDVIFVGKYADPKVSTFSVNSTLESVEPRYGYDYSPACQWYLDVEETGSEKWKKLKTDGGKVSGNMWIFVPRGDGKYWALPFEAFVSGLPAFPAENLNLGEYSVLAGSELDYPWVPKSGEKYGFMISTNAGLFKGSNGNSRSNIIMSEWP